ncbi:MAG: aspartate-semialdehyde dehydrogenase [Moraxellaceae bacterium]
MGTGCRLAIVGATGEVGRALISALEDAELELAEVHALASADSADETIMYRGRALLVEALDEFDFKRADIAIFALPEALALKFVPQARKAACRVIDHSAAFRLDPHVPLLIEGADIPDAALVACPGALTAVLAPVLSALTAYELKSVHVTALNPVSARGRAGVRELAGQTGELLNARGIEPVTFPVQIAFNALPIVGGQGGDALMDELERLLPEAVPVGLAEVVVPVFYGVSASLRVETALPLALAAAAKALKAAGISFGDSEQDQGVATPVTDASGQNGVYLSALSMLPAPLQGVQFWLVADNVRQGAACHSLYILKKWIKDFKY